MTQGIILAVESRVRPSTAQRRQCMAELALPADNDPLLLVAGLVPVLVPVLATVRNLSQSHSRTMRRGVTQGSCKRLSHSVTIPRHPSRSLPMGDYGSRGWGFKSLRAHHLSSIYELFRVGAMAE